MNIRAFVRGSNAVVVNKVTGVHYIPIHAISSRPVIINIIMIIINTIVIAVVPFASTLSHSSLFLLLISLSQRKLKQNKTKNALVSHIYMYIHIHICIYKSILFFSRRFICFSSRAYNAENIKTTSSSRSLSHNLSVIRARALSFFLSS